MFYILLLCSLFVFSNAYYLICNKDICIADAHLSILYQDIQKNYYSCYSLNNIKRIDKIYCYYSFFTFTPDIYQLKKCDNFDYEKQSNKEISNDPNLCTVNPVPYFTESSDFYNHTYASDPYIKVYNLVHTSKIKIENDIQTLALIVNAYAITGYTEKYIKIPVKKCYMRRVGKLITRRCKMHNINHIQITFQFIFI